MNHTPALRASVMTLLVQAGSRILDSEKSTIRVSDGEVTWTTTGHGSLFEVTKQSRANTPRAVMRASSFEDIERYLVSQLGADARARMRYYMISPPWKPGEEAAGFDLQDIGNYWYSLTRAASGAGGQQGRVEIKGEDYDAAVEFSHLADIPVDDLVASYLAPDGAPALQRYVTETR